MEQYQGEEIYSYYGDNVNSYQPEKDGRIPDPDKLVEGYTLSHRLLSYLPATEGMKADHIRR